MKFRFKHFIPLLCLNILYPIAPLQAQETSDSPLCLPFETIEQNAILSSPRKVFANYFLRHPLSLHNREWVNDYYARNYLQPHGEKDKWLTQGGFIRARPLPTPTWPEDAYKVENLKKEIRMAMARGINGFVFDILNIKDLSSFGYFDDMLEAVSAVDDRFKIVISPSVSSLKNGMDDVLTIVEETYDNPHPSLYRSKNGHLVVAAFHPEHYPISDWKKLFEKLKSKNIEVDFVPIFLSVRSSYIDAFKDLSIAFGTWGTASPNQGKTLAKNTVTAHKIGKEFWAGIQPQGYRPKSFKFWEPEASKGYRNSWEAAINAKADYIHLVTWNDFSESTQIEPYADSSGTPNTGFYDLTGYYANWFLAGQKPKITHDALYYFYRKQPFDALSPLAAQKTKPAFLNIWGVDVIELVGFLEEPGTLSIMINGKEKTQQVKSGLQTFHIPLETGIPTFTLKRAGETVLSLKGKTWIYGHSGLPNGFTDLTYWSGGVSTKTVCTPLNTENTK